MSKIEERCNTEYPNLPAFHSPLYNMRASFILRKKHPNEKKKKKREKVNKRLFRFKVTTNFQYVHYIISLYNQICSLRKSYIFSSTPQWLCGDIPAMDDQCMAYSIHGHISYILGVNSKRPIREKVKNRSFVQQIEWCEFFSFLTKIFHNKSFFICAFKLILIKALFTFSAQGE